MYKSALMLALVAMVGCKDTGKANEDACNDWIASMACGDTDWSTLVDCSVYADTTCDVSDYFTCLTDNTTCDEATGVADVSGWADCASKATCP